ncbi:Mediator of RNA polymerase II transcription subunit 27 [Linum perenne]
MDVKPNLQIQHSQQQLDSQAAAAATPSTSASQSAEAPPKQVALAMDRLSQAARIIADVRIGADQLLEALFFAAQSHQSNKTLQFFIKEDANMRQHLQELRTIGRQLEETGVLNDSMKSRGNSWGLNIPLVCPDGAVVAYAWKRQLAGQAGASAVDRTRLAVKAFSNQKRRYFPHLEDEDEEEEDQSTEPTAKKHCRPQTLLTSQLDELEDFKSLADVLACLEKEVPNVKVLTYQRLDWLKRAASLPTSGNENAIESSKEHTFHSLNKMRTSPQSSVASERISVIELSFPRTFRAVISLHPAGSIDPDSVAFFSPDEGGSYMHARGSSVHHVYRHITEHAGIALQHFLGVKTEAALYILLHWICSYQTIFSKVCSSCGRLLKLDRKSSMILPPVCRSFRQFFPARDSPSEPTSSNKDQGFVAPGAYHIGCYSSEL